MKRMILAAGVAAMMLAGAAVEAGHGHCHGHSGWNFSFVYGGGYYPRPYYAPYYYYPPPVVYAPPLLAPQVVVPLAQTTVPAAAANTAATTSSAPATVAQTNVVPTARPIRGVTLQNPATTGGNVAFVIDSRSDFELQPGDELPLLQKNAYYIEFDRGTGSGTMKRTLTEGTYEFVVTPQGWDLQKAADDGAPIPTPTVRRNTLPTTR